MKKREKLEIVKQHYPNAITTIDGVNKIVDFVEGVLDLEPGQVMLADSVCSDDVNSIQYPSRAQEFLGPFKMGGLNGFPFTGLTGMGAFSSHVPDNGAILIFFGPHTGVSKDGSLGGILRIGQTKLTGCCGAAKAALGKLQAGDIEEGEISELDYQQNILEQIVYKEKDRILNSNNPTFETTEVIYKAIEERILELVKLSKFNCKYIILSGAILINGDSDMGSFAENKLFDVFNLKDNTKKSYLELFLAQ